MGQLAVEAGAAMNAALICIGDELGLYRAMADAEPVTPAELAARTATHEAYVREWLNAQAAGGFVTYDAAAATYTLPLEHAIALADEHSPLSQAGLFEAVTAAIGSRERVARAFRTGEGVGWHEHHHGVPHGVARLFAVGYRTSLVADWIPALEGVEAKLRAGASVADVGCGHGESTILLAQAFRGRRSSASTSTPSPSRRRGGARAEECVEDRVTFAVAGASDFPGEGYDLVAHFDCLARPRGPGRGRAPRAGDPGRRRDVVGRRAAGGRPRGGQPASRSGGWTTASRRSSARPARWRSPAGWASGRRPARPG